MNSKYWIIRYATEKTENCCQILNRNNSENVFKNVRWKWCAYELLLTTITTRQRTKLRNAVNNNISTDLKFFKAQISKIIHSGRFLGPLLSRLAGPLIKVAVSLENKVLLTLGITAVASAIDAGVQKKIHGSGTATLITSNEEMNDIMKIVQPLFYW